MDKKIIISKDIAWIKPFVKAAEPLVPINNINRILSYRVVPGKAECVDGNNIRHAGERKRTITVKSKNQAFDKDGRFTGYSDVLIAHLLDTLAHELAHLVHWEHDHKHYKLTARINIKFAAVLKKYKIKDTYGIFKVY